MDPELAGLATVALLLLVKESGLPVPVPGDLLVLGAGVTTAASGEPPLLILGLIVVATVVGGIIQFVLARGAGRPVLLGMLRRFGVGDEPLERAGRSLRTRGLRGIAVARMTPGLRVVTIPAAALAAIPFATFAGGLGVGNAVFVGGHFALGYALGEPAVALVGAALGPIAVAVLLAAAVGLVGWAVIARRRRTAAPAAAWADAACPACLALALSAPAAPH